MHPFTTLRGPLLKQDMVASLACSSMATRHIAMPSRASAVVLLPRACSRGPVVHMRAASNEQSSPAEEPQRAIGCPDLYNMTEAINQMSTPTQPAPSTQPVASTSGDQQAAAAASSSSSPPIVEAEARESSTAKPAAARSSSYYSGLLTSELRQDNNASSSDMLARSLQLAGGVAAVLAALVYLFLASNGKV